MPTQSEWDLETNARTDTRTGQTALAQANSAEHSHTRTHSCRAADDDNEQRRRRRTRRRRRQRRQNTVPVSSPLPLAAHNSAPSSACQPPPLRRRYRQTDGAVNRLACALRTPCAPAAAAVAAANLAAGAPPLEQPPQPFDSTRCPHTRGSLPLV